MDLRRAGRDDDPARLDVKHSVAGPGDEQRACVGRHHFRAIGGIEDDDGLTACRRGSGGSSTARPATHHRDVHDAPPDLDFAMTRRCGRIRCCDHRQRRQPVRRVAGDRQPGSGRGLACPDVGDAVDLREAVAAIASQAERAA